MTSKTPDKTADTIHSDGTIQLLPPHVINRIAAGEVVERPASVVKELVENAIDAGATRIEVDATAGGRNIRIADNGQGMAADDAQRAFLNHATSKIRTAEDLDRIMTLGFRGEALASISSVSRMECTTRQHHADTGTKVTFDDAYNPVVNQTGCAPGTVMHVQDLFYNTPARLKFLKRPKTELSHIEETVQYLAMAHPEVQLTFTSGDQTLLKTRGTNDLRQAIADVLRLKSQASDQEELFPVTFEDPVDHLTLHGFIASPSAFKLLKSNKKCWFTFVNGRSVKDSVINRAIEGAFQSLVPDGRYATTILFVTMPPDAVDVNVHPSKREVRYAHPNQIYQAVHHAIRKTLEEHGHTITWGGLHSNGPTEGSPSHGSMPATSPFPNDPTNPLPTQSQLPTAFPNAFPNTSNAPGFPSSPASTVPQQHRGAFFGQPQLQPIHPNPASRDELNTSAMAFYTNPAQEDSSTPTSLLANTPQRDWRVIGQLFHTYILLETRQGLMVVDQHIASERSGFERLKSQLEADAPVKQQVIAAEAMPMSPTQLDLIEENRTAIETLGFEFTLDASEKSLMVTAYPLIYPKRQPANPTQLLLDVIQQFEDRGQAQVDVDDLLATLSCHGAVRAGDTLNLAQMDSIIEQWLAATLPWTCPHGRPIAHTIHTSELAAFFERPSLPVNAFGQP